MLLSKGSTGEQVRKVQRFLESQGYDVGDKGVDGHLGPDTEAAVEAFQRDHALKADGLIGSSTLVLMKSEGFRMENATRVDRMVIEREDYEPAIGGEYVRESATHAEVGESVKMKITVMGDTPWGEGPTLSDVSIKLAVQKALPASKVAPGPRGSLEPKFLSTDDDGRAKFNYEAPSRSAMDYIVAVVRSRQSDCATVARKVQRMYVGEEGPDSRPRRGVAAPPPRRSG